MKTFASVAAAAIVASALLVSACGDRQAAGPMQSQGAKENQVLQTPRDQVRDGGTFTWPTDNMPPNWNYHQLDGTELAASDISRA